MTNITGTIPNEVGTLSNMIYFDGSNNYLSEELPDKIITMGLSNNYHNLELLSLFDKDLDGEIPQEIGSLASLQQLSVYANIFTGPIPASIDSLEKLEDRDFVDNKFTGIIPDTIGNMIMSKSIHLYHTYYDNF